MQRFETPTFIIHTAGWLLFLTFPLLFINNEQSGQSSFLLLASPYYWLFCLTYMLMFYVNAMVLVPRLMFKKRYVIYSAVVLLLFGFVYYAQPYDNLLGHNKSVMAALGTLQDSQPKGLNRTLQPGNDSTVGPNAGMPFGPLPNEDLRMQDPNLKKPAGILDLHQSQNIDVISLFIFMMIMGLSIATSTVKRWQNAESKVVKAEAEKATAELSFLKAQINPHFLFNTLNNIYTQSVINSKHTSESIMKLSNIMRYVTDDVTQDFVMMKDEIDCVRDYIELQRLRLGADAEINFNVQGKPEGKKIAPLIFMTFIENAFKYGVTKKEKTIININLSIEKDKIDFTCENKIYQHKRNLERKGIGIMNTHQRLEHLYPNRFKLDINNVNEMFSVNLYVNC
ncbi:sensor histidine kinase [Pedobacter rhodius]|uniref:Sensor histidine kinase n=1 Tax=Pedobacter rhodius TaxID=3004098 RepID=A0ABT4KXR1_9SPHI|nr:sensor histidine kinase [Pedobacter sp. SJ11]MCZ4223716.1 sensor histidine kinase [Pedobacter sp. SJ11]